MENKEVFKNGKWIKATKEMWNSVSTRDRRTKNMKEEFVVDKEHPEYKESPAVVKEEPFYCCQCNKNTDGLSTCHLCSHMKGRWKTDKHSCKLKKGLFNELNKIARGF